MRIGIIISLQARDDELPEERREYLLTLTSASPGLDISHLSKHAEVTVAASDGPFGVFSFAHREIRLREEEGLVRSPRRRNRPRRRRTAVTL